MISLWKAASRGRHAFLCAFGIDIPVPLRYNRINKNLGGQNSMNFLEERIVKDGVVKAGNMQYIESRQLFKPPNGCAPVSPNGQRVQATFCR